jgi:hypothetical protein
MESVADLVARDRRSDAPACRVGASSHVYDYRRFCTTAWKAGNVLRHWGVREGVNVGVVPVPNPKAVLSVLGASLLGATVHLDPPGSFDGRAIVAPVDEIGGFDLPTGGQYVAFGGEPDDPAVEHWEQEVWSENPVLPPEAPGPDAPLLVDGDDTWTHGDVVGAAAELADDHDLDGGTTVCLRASLADSRAFAAALAPLAGGGELVFPGDDVVCDVGVGEDVPESRALSLADVPLWR